MGCDGSLEELKEAAACGAGGPPWLVLPLSGQDAGALCDFTVDDTVTYLLLGVVVGRFNIVLKHESKIVLRSVLKLLGPAIRCQSSALVLRSSAIISSWSVRHGQ